MFDDPLEFLVSHTGVIRRLLTATRLLGRRLGGGRLLLPGEPDRLDHRDQCLQLPRGAGATRGRVGEGRGPLGLRPGCFFGMTTRRFTLQRERTKSGSASFVILRNVA